MCEWRGSYGTAQFGPLCAGTDWVVGTSTGLAACALSAAINSYVVGLTTCTAASSSGVVYTTATWPGTAWNTFTINTSSNTTGGALKVVQMAGGQDNARLCVNGTCVNANKDFYPKTSTSVTATAIAAAFNASAASQTVTFVGANAVVSATATVVGTAPNAYTLSSSTNAVTTSLLVSSSAATGAQSGVFSGGQASAFTINTANVHLPSHGLGTATQVYVSSAGNSPLLYTAPDGATVRTLTFNTSYYAIIVDADNIELATTSTGAVAGLYVTWVSSQVKTTPDQYTLKVASTTLPSSWKWVVSNNGTDWVPFATTTFGQTVPSATLSAYTSTGTVTMADFGRMSYGWLGLSVNAPLRGGITVKGIVTGKD